MRTGKRRKTTGTNLGIAFKRCQSPKRVRIVLATTSGNGKPTGGDLNCGGNLKKV